MCPSTANLPAAADAVRDLFAAAGEYYEWGMPAMLVSSGDSGLPRIVPLLVDAVVNEVYRFRRPIELTPGGSAASEPCGIASPGCTSPRKGDGTCHVWQASPARRCSARTEAFEQPSTLIGKPGLYCVNVPVLEVPPRPTERQARAALHRLRDAFQTFPFADSKRQWDSELKLDLVDLSEPPGLDESTFLAGLLTAICRPCLYLAPGLILVAAQR